ncbi:Uma2 family endonuclease [Actinoallomurus sp. NPDC050550]|uniref:Uma2 family endonuclease n=1 Tax=Actinoallomurus sp. NPDC050550 TaxID=3154937 RepID=UPI0033E81953
MCSWRRRKRSAPRDSRHVEPEDILLITEILDSGDTGFERAWKPQRYADGGVPYYMELELSRLPRVRVYELRGRAYAETADAQAGETLKLPEPFALGFDPAWLVGVQRGVDRERAGS